LERGERNISCGIQDLGFEFFSLPEILFCMKGDKENFSLKSDEATLLSGRVLRGEGEAHAGELQIPQSRTVKKNKKR